MTYRLTYGATLAELTSLEEMMRILMESGQVHVDVINKLWQVYSKCGTTGATIWDSRGPYVCPSVFESCQGVAEAAETRCSHASRHVSGGQPEDCRNTSGGSHKDWSRYSWKGEPVDIT